MVEEEALDGPPDGAQDELGNAPDELGGGFVAVDADEPGDVRGNVDAERAGGGRTSPSPAAEGAWRA
eukprot:10637565-Alexandrium_andersonii.AAC.1